MKHATKKMLITALILFCAGLFLTTVGYIVAAVNDVSVYDENERPKADVKSETYNLNQLTGGESFTNLEIRFQVGNVVITKVTGSNQSTVQVSAVDMATFGHGVKDGVLSLADDDVYPSTYYGFSFTSNGFGFNGLRQILNFASAGNKNRTLYINLASDMADLQNITIHCGAGNVIVRNFTVKDSVSVSVSYGNISVDNISIGGSFSASTDLGNISMNDSSYARCELASTRGNIQAYLTGNGNNTFDSVAGNVTIEVKNPLQKYEITMSTTTGSVYVGDVEIGSDYTHYPDSNEQSLGKIIATAIVGSVKISQRGETTPSPV